MWLSPFAEHYYHQASGESIRGKEDKQTCRVSNESLVGIISGGGCVVSVPVVHILIPAKMNPCQLLHILLRT